VLMKCTPWQLSTLPLHNNPLEHVDTMRHFFCNLQNLIAPTFLPFIQRHATTTLLPSSLVHRCTISKTNRTNRQYHKKTIHETCYLRRALVFPAPRETSVCSILYYDTQHGTCMCVRACRWLVAAMCDRRSKLWCKTAKYAPL
jgi:hypothetical protein